MPNIRQFKNNRELEKFNYLHIGYFEKIEPKMALDANLQLLIFIVKKVPVLLFYNQKISDKEYEVLTGLDPSNIILSFSPNTPNITEVFKVVERAEKRIDRVRAGENRAGELLEWPERQLLDEGFILSELYNSKMFQWNYENAESKEPEIQEESVSETLTKLNVGTKTLYNKDSIDMSELKNDSVSLLVTSPPYFNEPNDKAGKIALNTSTSLFDRERNC